MCVQPWIPSWFSPTSPEPCLLHHQLLGSVLIRLPRSYLHSSPSCLHSSPSCSSPSRTPPPSRPPPHSESSSRSSNSLLCHLPPSAFPACPHTHSISSYAGSVGVFYHPSLSVHTSPSLCPEPGSSAPGHRKKVEDGICYSLLLLQGSPVPSVSPQPSVGALDHL